MIKRHEDLDIRGRPDFLVIMLVEMRNSIRCLAPLQLGADTRAFRWSPFNAIKVIVGSEDDELMLGLLPFFSEFEPVNERVGILSIDFVIYGAR